MSEVENTLARWIVQKGIDNIKPGMLSDELRKDALTEAGIIFFRQGNLSSAIKSLKLAENSEKLLELGEELMRQNKFKEAALAFIPTRNRKKLDEAAALCAKEGYFDLAFEAYIAAGNIEMAAFIKENI